jgi:hypothetical protein
MHGSRLVSLSLGAALAFALAGCGGKPDPFWSQLAGYKCGTDESAPAAICGTRPPGEGSAEVSRYCYQTLADANCLDRPDQDRKNQALGSSGY